MIRLVNEGKQDLGERLARRQTYEFAIIGGGVIGMAIAAALANTRRLVAIIDKAEEAALDITARSPAMLDPVSVPDPAVAALMRASHELYAELPRSVHPKTALHLFSLSHLRELIEAHASCRHHGVDLCETDAVEEQAPFLRPGEDHFAAALRAPAGIAHLLDIHRAYEHNRSHFCRHGGHIFHGEELLRARYAGGAWIIDTGGEPIRAKVIVNCAGAGADHVAERCDVTPLGLRHRRYTHIETSFVPHPFIPSPEGPVVTWHGAAELQVNFKLHGHVHLSLPSEHGEDHHEHGEARADVRDLRHGVDRLMQRTHLALASGGRHWTETRIFTADHRPTIGWADDSGFFWAAGHGHLGPQCAPAIARIVADQLLGERHFAERAKRYGIESEQFKPGRERKVPVHPT